MTARRDDVRLPQLPIETERLRLRAPRPEDLAPLHAIQSREDVSRWLYWGPRTVEDVSRSLDGQIHQDRTKELALVAERQDTGELIGHLTLTLGPPEHRQAEIGFMFHPDHHGNGYATEASRAVLALAFTTYDLHRVYGRLETRNTASARVLEKLGMRREAHLVENEWVKGEWQSEAIYAVLAREWRAQQDFEP
jgi:RimJ/RimL family protein N-acetyltransferase